MSTDLQVVVICAAVSVVVAMLCIASGLPDVSEKDGPDEWDEQYRKEHQHED